MRLLKKLFGRKVEDIIDVVERVDIPRARVDRVEFTIQWQDLTTGEIHEFDALDSEAYMKVVTNPNALLILD